MKNLLTLLGSTMIAVGISLMSVSCGDKKEKEESGDSGSGGTKKEGGAAPEAPADLEAQMIGFWAPDEEAMKKEMEKEIATDPNAAALAPMVEALMASMVIEVPKKGEVHIHMMGQTRTSTHETTSIDAATKTIIMQVTEDGQTEEGTATVEEDRLVLVKDGKTLILNRIDEAKAEERKANAKLPIPEGIVPDLETPAPTPPPLPE